jgi:hypothetical protein
MGAVRPHFSLYDRGFPAKALVNPDGGLSGWLEKPGLRQSAPAAVPAQRGCRCSGCLGRRALRGCGSQKGNHVGKDH